MASTSGATQPESLGEKHHKVHPNHNQSHVNSVHANNNEAAEAHAGPSTSSGTSGGQKIKKPAAHVVEATTLSHQTHRKVVQGPEYTLHLEEAKGLPVFWNGKEAVSRYTWKTTPGDLKFSLMTIGEVLEKFTAKDYLRYSNVSMSTDNKVFSTLRVSDAFSTLFRDNRLKAVKLILNETFRADRSREQTYKYILIMTEINKKKVLWDGKKPVETMIARINDPHMLLTVETMMKKYLPTDYLKTDGMIQLVTDKRNPDSSARDVKLDDLISSLFKGNSASIRLFNRKSEGDKDNKTFPSSPESDKFSSATDLEEFDQKSRESFWLNGNWNEIREKCQHLFDRLDIVERERDMSKYFHQKMTDERRNLETAMRRRSRSIDEVWRKYEILKTTADMAAQTFRYKADLKTAGSKTNTDLSMLDQTISPIIDQATSLVVEQLNSSINDAVNSSTLVSRRRPDDELPPPSESSGGLRVIGGGGVTIRSGNFLDGFATRLRGCGLEIYDEDNRISPIAGVALTLIVVAVVVAVTHYAT